MSGPMERVELTVSCGCGQRHTEHGWTSATPGLAVYRVTPCEQWFGEWWGLHVQAEDRDLWWYENPETAMADAAEYASEGDWTKGTPW